jgi:hypothetical protein
MSDDDVYATLSMFEPRKVEWLFEPLIPYGMLTVMEGDPGIGKSFAAMNFVALMSTGGNLPNGQRVKKKGALYCSAEDDLNYTIRPRIDAMEGDPKLIRVQEKYSPFDDDGLKLLRRETRKHPAGLVVIDPLPAYIPSDSNMYAPNEIRALLAQLSELAAETSAAFLIIRHLRKSKGDKAIYNGIGSIDVIGAARSAILVARHPDDPDIGVLAHLKHNLSVRGDSWGYRLVPDETTAIPNFEWTGKVNLSADQLTASDSGPSALDSAIDFLKQELSGGPIKATEIQKKAEARAIASRTIDRAKKELGVKVDKKGASWIWSLPKGRQGRQQSE